MFMASVKFQKGSEEWQMFVDYWDLCQKFWIVESAKVNKSYWEDMVQSAAEFVEKYNSDEFAMKLALAFLYVQGAKSE